MMAERSNQRASKRATGASRGRFVTLEGTEGVGKTTNLAVLAQRLRARGADLIETREPGGTALGERVRELLLDAGGEAPAPLAELLLVFAARAQHVDTVIRPALDAGRWVLSDRFTDATYAYQGAGRDLPRHAIAELESLVQGSLRPDLTVYLDLEPAIGFERIRGRELDRFEKERLAFFERVRAGYLERANAEPERFVIVSAAGTPDEVAAALIAAVDRRLDEWQAA
ncbi:MAG: dTMP kinase [Pseudomonadota bacterium]